MGAALTLGAEEELHVVDRRSGRLRASGPQLLRGLPGDGFSFELQRTTVETNTEVCDTLTGLRAELVRLRTKLDQTAAESGLGVAACGSAPMSNRDDFELTALGRFSRMQQDYRYLVDDQLICGLQIHVGVADRDVAVRVCQRVAADLPTLLALSASSPYWHGADTGYASFRTIVWQRWPTAGSFGEVADGAAYDRLIEDLIASGVISDPKMSYFDVRPSSHAPTVELRVCDACPDVDDAVLIAGLYRALVAEAIAADEAGDPIDARREPVHRAAMWRAARSGLAGPLLSPDAAPVPVPAAEVVHELAKRLKDRLEDSGDADVVAELVTAVLARGDSSTRQRRRFAERGRMGDVVALVVAETRGEGVAEVSRPALTERYEDSPPDEALAPGGIPYPSYAPLFETLDRLGPVELRRRADEVREHAVADGLTYGVDGRQQPFPVDLIPRVIAAHEWEELTAGLTQRARAIELFLRDIYGPARIIADGVLDWATVQEGPQWLAEARDLPAEVTRAPVIGFDLVRDALGGWRVLEDNTRVPSGVGYAIGMRRLMREVLPEIVDDSAIRDPNSALDLVGRTLRACALRASRVVALLSDGADNSAWFEHRMLAEGAGLLLVQPDEIDVGAGEVRVGGRRVDVVYLRIGVDLVDLRTSGGDEVGRTLLDAARHGDVVLANAPGAGVADDKAMYCLVPDFISYYLGERPLLAPVPTYRCANPAERGPVLERLDQLVTKPVDGYGGGGVLIGPYASSAELDERRREIEEHPMRWIAQETVELSTHPTLSIGANRELEPRHVDLRAFVYQSGTEENDAELADLALTRVAAKGSMVVNSSRGGGAKDTWIAVSTAAPATTTTASTTVSAAAPAALDRDERS